MKALIIPPEAGGRILPFYLAAEEWVAGHLSADDWFFAWQVSPTVICGRHQDMPLEVDLDYAREHGIAVWRRKSGGGCVYADNHNVMFSYITSGTGVQGCFHRYTDHICRMLAAMGITAEPTGRNDVAVSGHKVAGNAFYRSHGRSIVHGTMLYDADPDTMSRVLTPSRAKLASKGVQSVPARITTLRARGIAVSCDDFISRAMDFLGADGSYILTDTDIAQVEEIMQSYLRPDFLLREGRGAHPVRRSIRFDGVGELRASLALTDDNTIADLDLSGDFFGSYERKRELTDRLRGVSLSARAIAAALDGFPVTEAVEGADADTIVRLLTT